MILTKTLEVDGWNRSLTELKLKWIVCFNVCNPTDFYSQLWTRYWIQWKFCKHESMKGNCKVLN